MDDQIFEQLKEIVKESLNVPDAAIVPDALFTRDPKRPDVADLGADSLDLVELVQSIEEKFNIRIQDEEMQQIKTVGDAMTFVKRQLAAKSA